MYLTAIWSTCCRLLVSYMARLPLMSARMTHSAVAGSDWSMLVLIAQPAVW